MKKYQKIIVISAILIGVGVFVTSDFFKKPTSGGEDENFGGDCGCDPNADPYMMLEVDQRAFPNFDGGQDMVIAKNNYPFGENFRNRKMARVSAKPFYRANRRRS